MGTRHLICIFYKGKFVIAQYGQYDGYPLGQGLTIVTFLLDPANIAHLREGLEYIYFPPISELDQLEGFPSLVRETGAKILEIIATNGQTEKKQLPFFHRLEFANDAIFCEWAYVIDLDKEVLEVFGGSEDKPGSVVDRFDEVGSQNQTVPRFLSSYPFGDLPSESELERLENSI